MPTAQIMSKQSQEVSEDLAKDSLAAILRTLSRFALPTAAFPVATFAESCESLAREVLLRVGKQKKGESPRPLAHVYRDLRQLVHEQRQAESSEYRAHKESAKLIVTGLVGKLRQTLSKQEGSDSETLKRLSEMEQAVLIGDVDKIRDLTNKTAEHIRLAISQRQEQDQKLLQQLSGQLRSMRTELSAARDQAQHDGLTGLFNRAAFDQAFSKTMTLVRASGIDLSVFMLDLDHFKQVNDRFGHEVGDRVLKACANALVRSFPRRDDFVARFGGEEFVVLCRSVGKEHAPMLAERVRRAVANVTIQTEDATINPTISVGYALHKPDDLAEQLLKRADEALYRAKELGRNQACGEPED